MATFHSIEAVPETGSGGASIRLRFAFSNGSGDPGPLGWRLLDPDTGVFLEEGSWPEMETGTSMELRVPLPKVPGPYRVEVAPTLDRAKFIALEAMVTSNGNGIPAVTIATPRIETAGSDQRRRLWAMIPKAFSVPVRSLWTNRKLMRSMVSRDIASRYQGSFFGAVWTFLNPLLLMATYFFVFGVVLRSRWAGDATQEGYVLYFLAGMLPWLAFSEAAGRAPTIILDHRTFVSKLVFPLETLPANLVLAGLVTELFGLAIFLTGLLVVRGAIPATVVWLPVVLIPQILLTAGIAWLLAATGIFMRDLGQVIGFLLTLGFFLTPICYPESSLPPEAMALMQFNPIYILVTGYRSILLESQAPLTAAMGWLWAGSLLVAVAGHGWFHKLRKSFADVI